MSSVSGLMKAPTFHLNAYLPIDLYNLIYCNLQNLLRTLLDITGVEIENENKECHL